VSFLGLPADPTWAGHILEIVEAKERVEEIDGIGCQPVLISVTAEEIVDWIGDGLRSGSLALPEKNGPIVWPPFSLAASLNPGCDNHSSQAESDPAEHLMTVDFQSQVS
jgi:hypothetical protein